MEKTYFKIKEVAEMLGVPQSTLRFWEKEFPECAPKRSKTNIRYYTAQDIELLKVIHYLLKMKGLRIDAAKEQLKANRENVFKRMEIIETLTGVRNELEGMLSALKKRQ